ncbi:hypothetical protein [Ensifer soli]|uniref:hypothetical protein n=1 Tax=Ciceribacter sp. sgz301302 TaxID=3342379 RepID=UPI0035B78E82
MAENVLAGNPLADDPALRDSDWLVVNPFALPLEDAHACAGVLAALSATDVDDTRLEEWLGIGCDGIYLKGTAERADIQRLDVALSVAEALSDRAAGAAVIVAEIATTAQGLLSTASLAGSSERLAALVFDETEVMRNLGIEAGAPAVAFARVHAVLKARQAGLPVLEVLPLAAPNRDAALARSRSEGFDAIAWRLA